jgi:protein phosphatase
MVRQGGLRPEQAKNHPFRHIVTNAVGGNEEGVQAEVHKVEVGPGDIMLLCSDGLTEMLSDERINEVLRAVEEPRGACERLVAEANELGGRDNITALVARFEELSGHA